MSRKIVATYEMIKGYQNKPSNNWLALSEFIDNSIASYQENDRNKPINGLCVNITFDATNEDDEKIIIADNAKGMGPDELENAMQPNDRTDKNDVQYNQYGVGMKLGIYWHGANGTIYSKKEKSPECKLELFTEGKDRQNREIVVDAEKSKDNVIKFNTGTTIIISKVYKNKSPIFQKDMINKISNALGWRYSKLIDKGLTIRLIVKSNDTNKNDDITIKSFKIQPFKISDLLHEKNTTETKDQRLDVYYKRLNDLYQDFINNEDKYRKNESILQAYNLMNSNQEVVLEKYININEKQVKLKYGIISSTRKNMMQYCGVTIYHLDRAIMHGPNDFNNKTGNFLFLEKVLGSGGSGDSQQVRWLFGELDLTGVEVPDENKSRFIWSIDGEEDIRKALKKIFDDMKPILDIITKTAEVKSNNLMNEKEAIKVLKQSCEKLETFKKFKTVKNEDDEIGFAGKCKILGEVYDVEIFETNSKDVKFIDVHKDTFDKKITIRIEAEHKFWKPMIGKEDFKGSFLYPITLLIGVTEFIYGNEEFLESINSSNKTYSEVITYILEDWSKN